MNNRLSKKCRFWRDGLLAFLVAVQTVVSASAVTIHRSFRPRETGLGFDTGTASVAYPIDAKIDKAIGDQVLEQVKEFCGRLLGVQATGSMI